MEVLSLTQQKRKRQFSITVHWNQNHKHGCRRSVNPIEEDKSYLHKALDVVDIMNPPKYWNFQHRSVLIM